MLGYQSDAEKNGAAVALNSSLLSGDVSGIQLNLHFKLFPPLIWCAMSKHLILCFSTSPGRSFGEIISLVAYFSLQQNAVHRYACSPSRCEEEAASGGQQDWGGQQPHS